MNPKIKKLWIEALRSGKYRQVDGELRGKTKSGKTGFCCLGVLCNLHAQAHPEIAMNEFDPSRYLGAVAVLPTAVQRWADLDESGTLPTTVEFNGADYDTLYELNDDGMKFGKIANVIDQLL